MFKQIDCVMIKVADPWEAAKYYQRVFGMTPIWEDEQSIGMRFPEGDRGTELVLHCIEAIPVEVDVN